MKRDDVPQHGSATLSGERKAVYAVDAHGRYSREATSGWDAEEAVTRLALEEFRRLAAEARERVVAGESAPLEVHMYQQRMDPDTLAQATGLFRWRVRRHLRARVYRRLPERIRARYAAALGRSADELAVLPPEEDGGS
ncbi:hypothetical protein QWY84_05765 [Aquisalimonas lutea]|uniref:hypothetical protein n=1 Tax=Aquisalimonas lutea TaxID=1327750 RepID=UPI0025B5880A|nr:hypothetical protein [Aquisalimonas lutea]MDN3517111.1 hypothetical protein [Aquisalimonas lutea]